MRLLSVIILIFAAHSAVAALKGEESRRYSPSGDAEKQRHERHHMNSTVRVNFALSGDFIGSGVLVNAPNILLTNWHVLYDQKSGKRKSGTAVQFDPSAHSRHIGFDWSNHWCDEALDVCVIELDEDVPGAGAVKVVDTIPESFLRNPSKLGEITVSGFGLELFRSREDYGEQMDSSTEATTLIPPAVEREARRKKIEGCFARDYDPVIDDLLGDCDSRQGISGAGAAVPLEGIATLIGYVHNQRVGDIEDGDPYDKIDNAIVIKPISEEISNRIHAVHKRSLN